MSTNAHDISALLAANAALKERLDETEETLAAIRSGDVDGLVVGEDIYILDSVNAANNRLRNDVLAQMEDAVLAFDTDDHIIFMNVAAECQYGQEASDALGHPRSQLFSEEWPDAEEEQLARASMQASGAYRAHSIHVRHDGVIFHVESTVSRLRDIGGTAVGYLAVIRDITHRVQVEETLQAATVALQEADRRKDEFLATLAHELRNPLAPIRNALQIMKLSRDPTIVENAREIIQRQIAQMVHLVDDLLDVSRISQGKVELRRELIDVRHAVQSAIETSKPAIERGQHTLCVELPEPKTLIVNADHTRLCQIVANLLNNAAKYTLPGGCIVVSVQAESNEAVIRVRDSGIGIPQEMLPRIFEMFAQVDRSLDQTQGGLGIGLALVKSLVEMHGGTVCATSAGPGYGSEFIVRIPAQCETFVASTTLTKSKLETQSAGGYRVLVVDDNADSAESLAQILEMLGYETRIAHDGEVAVSMAESYRPQAVLLDIGLPKLNGFEAAKRIRKQCDGKDILLIALSGWGQEEDRRKSKEAGFDHHFVKPMSIETLSDLLSRSPSH